MVKISQSSSCVFLIVVLLSAIYLLFSQDVRARHNSDAAICGTAKQAPIIVVGKILSVGGKPGFWSGLLAAYQDVRYAVAENVNGKDLDFALIKFYLLPLIEELAVLKEIERYRPKERAIGIPIIVHDDNFLHKSDLERRKFLKQTILEKLDLLAGVVKRNKLDTNVELLKADVAKVLS